MGYPRGKLILSAKKFPGVAERRQESKGLHQHGNRFGAGGGGGVAESALERSYPVVYFDALRVKIRDEGKREEQGSLPGSRHRG